MRTLLMMFVVMTRPTFTPAPKIWLKSLHTRVWTLSPLR